MIKHIQIVILCLLVGCAHSQKEPSKFFSLSELSNRNDVVKIEINSKIKKDKKIEVIDKNIIKAFLLGLNSCQEIAQIDCGSSYELSCFTKNRLYVIEASTTCQGFIKIYNSHGHDIYYRYDKSLSEILKTMGLK